MIIRNHGLGLLAARHLGGIGWQVGREFVRKTGGAVLRVLYSVAGLLIGLTAGVYWLMRTGSNPARDDAEGQAIRRQLQENRAERSTVNA